MCSVLEARRTLQTAPLVVGLDTIVATKKMLGLFVEVIETIEFFQILA